ncbi:hypothetical protein BBJ28_00006604 [Nothophytophthora sp. Chile5]|nr:hypothetical protein BBJ28_00006604 [Nothophytophthora sp. Chile5]
MDSPAAELDSTRELARNLPALVAQLKALRTDMERKSKLYDALLLDQATRDPSKPTGEASDSSAALADRPSERQSIFTPFANADLDPRASQMFGDEALLDDGHYANTLVSRQSSMMMRQQQQRAPQRPVHHYQHPTASYSPYRATGDYTVMWVSGECGISLRNFSRKDSKIGAQIAVLQHADGVTTGISNCRLGDQLVSVNDDRVDTLRFREIVEKLKTTRRPVSLGFRTNPNVQTSPRASTTPPNSGFSNTTGGSRHNKLFSRSGSFRPRLSLKKKEKASSPSRPEPRQTLSEGGSRSSSGGFFEEEESGDTVRETMDHFGYEDSNGNREAARASGGRTSLNSEFASTADRATTTSVRSSTSTMSDDVEMWCKEQEEMHSGIIVLLTETVMRCEKLQQENMDQLENLMQLTPSSPRTSDRSSSTASSFTETLGKELDLKSDDMAVKSSVSAAATSVLASPIA